MQTTVEPGLVHGYAYTLSPGGISAGCVTLSCDNGTDVIVHLVGSSKGVVLRLNGISMVLSETLKRILGKGIPPEGVSPERAVDDHLLMVRAIECASDVCDPDAVDQLVARTRASRRPKRVYTTSEQVRLCNHAVQHLIALFGLEAPTVL